ncbi:TPA: hypothetical protein ACX6RX_003197 [Photobacterium damselae]
MANKRLFIVSLSGNRPMSMLAGFRDGTLHIAECKSLPNNIRTLKKELPEQMKKLAGKGFIILIDEVVPIFSQYGRAISLSDIDANGVPIVISAMRSYRNMNDLQMITLPTGDGGIFDINDSLVEEIRDGKGQIAYRINWSELKTESSMLLLAISAALNDSLLDKSTMSDLIKLIGSSQEQTTLSSPFINIISTIDTQLLGGE